MVVTVDAGFQQESARLRLLDRVSQYLGLRPLGFPFHQSRTLMQLRVGAEGPRRGVGFQVFSVS